MPLVVKKLFSNRKVMVILLLASIGLLLFFMKAQAAAPNIMHMSIWQAEGEAAALKLVSTALQADPSLLTYRYVEKLSPNVQVIMLPNGAPFILDPKGFVQQPIVTPTETLTGTRGADVAPTPGAE